ncbi:MAG TPA: CNNM domain-containing protein, partial [Balneolaceae bacterium]|nr:CNNM domain-containing protein [Balneolaceae bacterium]
MIEISLIILSIFLVAFFSGSEVAFINANQLKLEIESRRGSRTGRTVSYFVRNPEAFLTTALIGKNIIIVIYATLMTLFLLAPVTGWYQILFGVMPSQVMLLLIQIVFTSVIIILFGEILPKALFRIHADRWMKIIAVPQRIFYWFFKPFIIVVNATSNLLNQIVYPNSEAGDATFRPVNVELTLKKFGKIGGSDLDKEDSEILHNVLELSNKRVKESMIPRTDIMAVEKSTSIDETLKLFISSGFSKLPIYQESIDDIIGVIFAYDLFSNPESLTKIIRPVKLVPVSKKSKDLLSEFRQSNISVAVVIDEYGGTAGMV